MNVVGLLITLIILAAIFAIAWWALQKIPLPPPFPTVVQIVLAIIAILVLASFLTGHISFPLLVR